MSSNEHKELVAVIRGMSDNMRKECFKCGGNYEKVWQEHLLANDMREQYAQSMLKLATSIWPQSNSRIHWCYNIIQNYFFNGGLEKSLKRHLRCILWEKEGTNIITPENMYINIKFQFYDEKYTLLDVGSCYNPFSKFQDLHTVSVDLTPATQDVYKCDFLQLEIIPSSSIQNFPELPGSLSQLKEESFHIVVFSLFLSYLPAAEQRLISCHKAWKLLKENGILLLITPDSKSQHCNSSMIKSWRTALKHLGFMKIVYEKKQHFHCMAYRKTLFTTFHPDNINYVDISKMMYIPQDFKKYPDIPIPVVRSKEDNENVKNIFLELPLYSE